MPLLQVRQETDPGGSDKTNKQKKKKAIRAVLLNGRE